MSNTLGTVRKAPGERIRLPVDFGDVPQLVAGASGGAPDPLVLAVNIDSYTVTCSGAGAPTVSGAQLDYPYQVSALLSGGTTGSYTVTYTIVLDDVDQTTVIRTGTVEVG